VSFESYATTLFLVAVCATGAYLLFKSRIRAQTEVVGELFAESAEEEQALSVRIDGRQLDLSPEALAVGTLDREERRVFERRLRLYPLIGAIVGSGVKFMLFPSSAPASMAIALAILGFAVGYLVAQAARRAKVFAWERRCQFSLPITMERLVMGVQAGLDLLAALAVILKDEKENPTNDSVLELLEVVMKLTEAGLPFERALKEVAGKVQFTAIRHAFTHLAVAHREGGELVMPLKELSDATQSFYQETIEEEIARLPVKATLPLLCTFAGLIIFFITSPLIQVITMTAGVSAGLK
jgi:Flp pilus assembly protein TadB